MTQPGSWKDDPVVRFLARIGVEVKSQTSSGYLCLCPLHGSDNEAVRTPSLSVRLDGMFHCFGTCGRSGYGFVQLARVTGYPQREALELVQAYGLPEEAEGADVRRPTDRPERILLGRYATDWLEVDFAFRRQAAHVQPEALTAAAAEYLFGTRRLNYDTLSWARVGLDRQHDLIVFPQFEDEEARHAGISAAGLSTRSPTSKRFRNQLDTSRYLYPLPPEDPEDDLILVEGQLDALAVRQATGLQYGTSLYGSAARDSWDPNSGKQVLQLRRHNGTLILFMDNDLAGIQATTKLLSLLGPHRCRVVTNFFGCKDAGDMTPAQIQEAISTTIPGGEYVCSSAAKHRLYLVRQPKQYAGEEPVD